MKNARGHVSRIGERLLSVALAACAWLCTCVAFGQALPDNPRYVFQSIGDLSRMDVDFLTRFLSKPALETVLALKERYGTEPVPVAERYAARATEFIPSKLRGGYERIIGALFEAEPHFRHLESGDTQVEFRFDEKVDLDLDRLSHDGASG